MRPSLKCLLVGVVVAAVFATAAPQADAQWYGYRAWGCGYYGCGYTPSYSCYSPCYSTVGCYSSCYDNCGWYLGCRPGPIRRALFGPYRWYSTGWYSGCYTGCYTGCSTGCVTGCDSCTGNGTAAPAQTPTPAKKPAEPPMPAEPAPAAPAAPAAPKTTGMSAEESGILTVWVPYDAKVTINGRETKSTGSQRRFVSYDLKPGLSYKYEVKAQIVRNGQTQEDTRTVIMTAGEVTAVAFGFNVSAQQVASAR